jgi:UDPglucose 6-dehydrogenase
VGLGKLGACIAAALASRGFGVIGVDIDPEKVSLINRARAPVFEPGLAELLGQVHDRLQATEDFRDAILRSDATFIVVPTPSADHGGFSVAYVQDAVRAIGAALREKPGDHLVVLTSTVLPGATTGEILPLLEETSHKRVGEGLGFCYSPEFVALGTVIHDLLHPDFVLIGESDEAAGERLAVIYRQLCGSSVRIARMNLVNAELAKIAVNTFVTTKITFANTLAAICERLPGGDIDAVTSALALDGRIGAKYLRGALGYGGPCFPRDNLAFAAFARELGIAVPLAEATDALNREIPDRVAGMVVRRVEAPGIVAVLGLAYKPGTNVVEESQGVMLAEALVRRRMRVIVFDPAATDMARRVLLDRVEYASTLEDAVHAADAIVLATPDQAFRDLVAALPPDASGVVVLDIWRSFRDVLEGDPRITYVALGTGAAAAMVQATSRGHG